MCGFKRYTYSVISFFVSARVKELRRSTLQNRESYKKASPSATKVCNMSYLKNAR